MELAPTWYGHGDLNPNAKAREPKSRMSTNSIMPANMSGRDTWRYFVISAFTGKETLLPQKISLFNFFLDFRDRHSRFINSDI